MTRASRPAYWKVVRAIARTLARHPELGAPQIRPSSVASWIADLDGGAGGFGAAVAWVRALDDILCIDVTPSVAVVFVTVTGRLGGWPVQVSVMAPHGLALVQAHAEISASDLDVLAAESRETMAMAGAR
jgi:hypothetical protein